MALMLFWATPLSRVYLWKLTLKPRNDGGEIDFSWQMFFVVFTADSVWRSRCIFITQHAFKTSPWKTSHWFFLAHSFKECCVGSLKGKSDIKYQLCLSLCRNMESLFPWLLKRRGAWMPTSCTSGGMFASSEQGQLEINTFLHSKLFYSAVLSLESWRIPR